VNGELKDVAKGTIVQPLGKDLHTVRMRQDIFRVKYDLVLPGYDGLKPPSQPQGWDDETPAVLGTGFGYMYEWPKSQIRLGTEGQATTAPKPPAQPAIEPAQPAIEPAQPAHEPAQPAHEDV
jgi:hypothetical protein